jgi:O-antigen/teichoic acid export membrane protein
MVWFSSSKKRLLKEGVWSTFGKVTTALGTLVGIRLLTEFVSKEVYGELSLLIGLMILASNFFTGPLFLAVQRFYPDAAFSGTILTFRHTVVSTLKWLGGILIGLILIGGALCSCYYAVSFLAFLAIAGCLITKIALRLEVCLLTAARRQKASAICQVLEAWCKPAIAILIVILLGATSQSVLFGYFIAIAGIVVIIHYLPMRAEGVDYSKQGKFETDTKLLKNIWVYALPLIPQALVGWIISFSDRYIVGGLLGTADVGLYSVAYGVVGAPFLIAGASISQTIRPPYYNAVASSDKRLEKKMLRTWLLAALLISTLGVIAVYGLRHLIAAIVLAEKYRSSVLLMPWIAGGMGLQIIAQVYDSVFLAYKKTKLVLISQVIGAIICLISVFLLTVKFGLLGTAIACPVYFFALVIVKILLIARVKKAAHE